MDPVGERRGRAQPLGRGARGQDQLFRFLVSSVRDHAIFAGAERLYGYRADEIVGAHMSRLFTPDDVQRHHAEEELHRASEQMEEAVGDQVFLTVKFPVLGRTAGCASSAASRPTSRRASGPRPTCAG